MALIDLARKQVFSVSVISTHYGICGEIFSDQEAKLELQQVEQVCLDQAHALIQELLASVARGDSANRQRSIEVLLDYTASHLQVSAGVLRCEDAIAEMILQLPLFESAHGIPLHARHLITRHLYDATRGLSDRWRETVTDLTGVEGRWLAQICDGRLIPTVPQNEALPALFIAMSVGTRKEVISLLDWLRSGIQTLRPDVFQTPDLIGIQAGSDAQLVSFRNDLSTILINIEHPIFCAALGEESNRNGHWLMLAIYAFLNDFRHEITNAHELAFQASLANEILESSKRA